MAKYKLIVVAADEHVTKEFANVVNNLKDAAEKAEELRKQYDDGSYSDVHVACYPYCEDIRHPCADYRCWQKDADGETYWKWMKMGTYCRIGMYIK